MTRNHHDPWDDVYSKPTESEYVECAGCGADVDVHGPVACPECGTDVITSIMDK